MKRQITKFEKSQASILSLVMALIVSGCVKPDRPPNIILILADDIGIETVGAYGGPYSTPNIDSLARNGVRFDQGHATPVCTTTRTRLLAGTYNFKHYKAFAHLDPSLYSLPRYIKDAGYQSVVVGKWQLAGNMEYGGTGTYPWDAGYDEHLVWQLERSLKGSRYWQPTLTENGLAKTYCKDDFAPTLFNDFILDFIDRNRDEPFFVHYNPVLAHDPWTTTPDSLEAESPEEKFSGMMSYLDKMVGRVLARLEEHELADNTLIWFIGDNGTHPQITSLRNGKPVTGGKWLTKDAGTHVPFIMQWKNKLPSGAVRNELVEILDVYPTLASVIGGDLKTDLDGLDLIPYATGETTSTRDWVFMHYDPQWGSDYFKSPMPAARFIFNRKWKLYGDGRFYQTDSDPLEQHVLSQDELSAEALEAYRNLKEQFYAMNDGPLKPPYQNSGLKAVTLPEPNPDCNE